MDFIQAWCLTNSIETIILFVLLRERYEHMLIVRNSVLASSLTLPFVWFLFPVLGFGSWALQTTLAEIFAFSIETCIYRMLFRKMSWMDALKASALCNAASLIAGLVL